jgi:Ca2+-binding RTX toxin-like protein
MAIVIGTFGPDDLSATPKQDLVLGLDGDDRLDGLAGNDLMLGGRGRDTTFGGEGADIVLGGAGIDSLDGFEGDDLMLGGRGNDMMFGGEGGDTILGGPGDDRISGWGSAEFFRPLRADGADRLLGGAGNDVIEGWGGGDTIFGGPGDDALIGSYDADRLTGGRGRDVFFFGLQPSAGAPFPIVRDTGVGDGNRDVVTDFQQGEDLLDLTGHRNPAGGQLPSVFLGTEEFIGTLALQVRYEVLEDGNTLVQFAGIIGRTANVPPDFVLPAPNLPNGEILLIGAHQLTRHDFIF